MCIRDRYQAYSSFVVETKTAYGYNQSYSDETTAGQLSKTFPYILTSGALSDIVAESLGVDSIPASISAEAIQDTSIFTINVTASDPQIAYDVLQAVIKYYPQVAEYIICLLYTSGSLVLGSPAKIKRNLTWEEKLGNLENSREYVKVSGEMKAQGIL